MNPPRPHGDTPPGLAIALGRGLTFRCPACGEGRLFRSFLKQVEACEACGEPLGEIRADDGPAWLTVLVLGPFLVGITFFVSFSALPLWLSLPVAAVAVTSLVLLLLPRIKGMFIAALWLSARSSRGGNGR